MKKLLVILFCLPIGILAQSKQDTTKIFKKRVLKSTEINILTSYYSQDGDNASVTGGIGTEKLTDFATNINVAIPLNNDDVLSIDATVSAYTSASSSNLNPFDGVSNSSGASRGRGRDDDKIINSSDKVTGSPWVASSGASRSDVWVNGNFGYSHSSDDRNEVYGAHLSVASEYDYTSFGAGIDFLKLFNHKNTQLSLSPKIYLDTWNPKYPTEIKTYVDENGNLNGGFFNGVPILDSNGRPIDKNGTNVWKPINTTLITDKSRNTYIFSFGFSQVLNKRTQISFFSDITYQKGWLANPTQRVYFSDVANFYIGNASSIPIYTSPSNKDVFQLADDIERLPNSRFKIPIGVRLNFYINEYMVLRTYYRYYFDDWDIRSNTFNIELPIKLGDKFTLYPNYRYYNQSAAKYFAPYEKHLSTETYYTSDYDLSKFSSNQFGLGIKYSDILTKDHIGKMGLKNITLNYNFYTRNTRFHAGIISLGAKFIIDN